MWTVIQGISIYWESGIKIKRPTLPELTGRKAVLLLVEKDWQCFTWPGL